MDFEGIPIIEIVLFILGTGSSIAGYYIRDVYTRMKTLETDFANHRVDDVKEFVSKEALQELKTDIKDFLAPMSAKLESIEEYLREGKNNTH